MAAARRSSTGEKPRAEGRTRRKPALKAGFLRPEDAAALIAQTGSESSVLVGGQAVHFWASHFGIGSILPALTRDIDYKGTRAEAARAADRLTFDHQLRIATLDDATASAAVLTVRMSGYAEPVLIDFVTGVYGLKESEVTSSALNAEIGGARLKVLHPLSLMKSKIWNLARLSAKQTPEGVEQARLSIEIVAAYIRAAVGRGASRRELLRTVKAVVDLALTVPAREVLASHGLDCADALPKEIFAGGVLPEEFHSKHWPRISQSLRRR